MSPSTFQSGSDTGSVSWEEKIATQYDETTAVACIRGIRREERARRVLGIINREGVTGRRKEVVVERVRELS